METRCETGVAGLDGVLSVAQQMGEAKLAFASVPGLRGITVGDPHIGLGLAKEIGQHRRAAAVGDQMVDGGRRHQHPLPPVFPLDTGRGLVRGHYPRFREGRLLLLRTSAAVVSAAAVSGVPARASMLAMAPSLRRTPNTSSSSRTSRSNPIAWVTWRWRISAVKSGPKGEPGDIPAGGAALKPRRQLGHTPR